MEKSHFSGEESLFDSLSVMRMALNNASPVGVLKLYRMLIKSLELHFPKFWVKIEDNIDLQCGEILEDYISTRALSKLTIEFYVEIDNSKSKLRVGLTFSVSTDSLVHCYVSNPISNDTLILSFRYGELEVALNEITLFLSSTFNDLGYKFIPSNALINIPPYIFVYGRDFYLYKSSIGSSRCLMPETLSVDHQAFAEYLIEKSKNPDLPSYTQGSEPIFFLLNEYIRIGKLMKENGEFSDLKHVKLVEQSFNEKYWQHLPLLN